MGGGGELERGEDGTRETRRRRAGRGGSGSGEGVGEEGGKGLGNCRQGGGHRGVTGV